MAVDIEQSISKPPEGSLIRPTLLQTTWFRIMMGAIVAVVAVVIIIVAVVVTGSKKSEEDNKTPESSPTSTTFIKLPPKLMATTADWLSWLEKCKKVKDEEALKECIEHIFIEPTGLQGVDDKLAKVNLKKLKKLDVTKVKKARDGIATLLKHQDGIAAIATAMKNENQVPSQAIKDKCISARVLFNESVFDAFIDGLKINAALSATSTTPKPAKVEIVDETGTNDNGGEESSDTGGDSDDKTFAADFADWIGALKAKKKLFIDLNEAKVEEKLLDFAKRASDSSLTSAGLTKTDKSVILFVKMAKNATKILSAWSSPDDVPIALDLVDLISEYGDFIKGYPEWLGKHHIMGLEKFIEFMNSAKCKTASDCPLPLDCAQQLEVYSGPEASLTRACKKADALNIITALKEFFALVTAISEYINAGNPGAKHEDALAFDDKRPKIKGKLLEDSAWEYYEKKTQHPRKNFQDRAFKTEKLDLTIKDDQQMLEKYEKDGKPAGVHADAIALAPHFHVLKAASVIIQTAQSDPKHHLTLAEVASLEKLQQPPISDYVLFTKIQAMINTRSQKLVQTNYKDNLNKLLNEFSTIVVDTNSSAKVLENKAEEIANLVHSRPSTVDDDIFPVSDAVLMKACAPTVDHAKKHTIINHLIKNYVRPKEMDQIIEAICKVTDITKIDKPITDNLKILTTLYDRGQKEAGSSPPTVNSVKEDIIKVLFHQVTNTREIEAKKLAHVKRMYKAYYLLLHDNDVSANKDDVQELLNKLPLKATAVGNDIACTQKNLSDAIALQADKQAELINLWDYRITLRYLLSPKSKHDCKTIKESAVEDPDKEAKFQKSIEEMILAHEMAEEVDVVLKPYHCTNDTNILDLKGTTALPGKFAALWTGLHTKLDAVCAKASTLPADMSVSMALDQEVANYLSNLKSKVESAYEEQTLQDYHVKIVLNEIRPTLAGLDKPIEELDKSLKGDPSKFWQDLKANPDDITNLTRLATSEMLPKAGHQALREWLELSKPVKKPEFVNHGLNILDAKNIAKECVEMKISAAGKPLPEQLKAIKVLEKNLPPVSLSSQDSFTDNFSLKTLLDNVKAIVKDAKKIEDIAKFMDSMVKMTETFAKAETEYEKYCAPNKPAWGARKVNHVVAKLIRRLANALSQCREIQNETNLDPTLVESVNKTNIPGKDKQITNFYIWNNYASEIEKALREVTISHLNYLAQRVVGDYNQAETAASLLLAFYEQQKKDNNLKFDGTKLSFITPLAPNALDATIKKNWWDSWFVTLANLAGKGCSDFNALKAKIETDMGLIGLLKDPQKATLLALEKLEADLPEPTIQ